MKTIGILLALLSGSLVAQVITGHGGKFGPGRILVVDNCTLFKDGQTNAVTGSDYNFRHWWASRINTSESYQACHFSMVLSKVGSPTGAVSLALFTDNSGQPGTLLIESAQLTNSQITASAATNLFPGITWSMTNGVTLWSAVHFTDVVDVGSTTNLFRIYNHFTGIAPDAIWISDDGVGWADGGNRAFLEFQILTRQ